MILWGVVAFNFCLEIAILLLLLKIWLDVYHHRWLSVMEELKKVLK